MILSTNHPAMPGKTLCNIASGLKFEDDLLVGLMEVNHLGVVE